MNLECFHNSYRDSCNLVRIADETMSQSLFYDQIGLFHGKMGAALFLYQLSRIVKNSRYEEFADCLIDDICSEISLMMTVDIEYGICGIGWAFIYLIINGYIHGDLDEILSDVDRMVMQRDLRFCVDNSIRTGVQGVQEYILARVNYSQLTLSQLFHKEYYQSKIIKQYLNAYHYKHKSLIIPELMSFCNSKNKVNSYSWQRGLLIINEITPLML